jgi:lysozyme family protein
MSLQQNRIINHVLKLEGGYVDDPSDSGGETNYGITVGVARTAGYTGRMQDMPQQFAYDLYVQRYWDPVRADDLLLVSPELAGEVVDTCINMGVFRAGIFLQRALNVLNRNASLYSDLKADGNIGNKTIKALRAYSGRRDIEALLKALNCLQGAFYIQLCERREKDERFLYGWLNNRVVL